MERLALALILVLLPHTKVPAVDLIYPIRPADVVLLIAAIVYLRWSLAPHRRPVAAPEMLIAFGVSVFSALWGAYQLNVANLDIVIVNGRQFPYYLIALKKLLLICISFLGFQFFYSSRSLSNELLLKYWHRGLWIAVALHALCYVVTTDYFEVRAGVFVEGNHGGSYYLLSFFLMWFAQQHGLRFGLSGMVLALAGLALSQSSASMVLWLPLAVVAFLSLPARIRKATLRFRSGGAMLAVICALAVAFGPEVLLKLTGEEIDSTSFSRYDRIASVMSGINMFLAHPVFGVGIQGYAFALPQFVDSFIESFFDWNSRRIANNIYVELLAEQGIIGLVAMLLVMFRICKPIFRRFRQHSVLVVGVSSIFLGWVAFPTYTISFQWVGLAILVRLAVQGLEVPPLRPRHEATGNAIPDAKQALSLDG